MADQQINITVTDLIPPSNIATVDKNAMVGNAYDKKQTDDKLATVQTDYNTKIAEVRAEVKTDFKGTIKPSTPTPTEDGAYRPEISSELDKPADPNSTADWGEKYPNAGNLRAKTGYDTMFYKKGTVWTRVETKIPGTAAKQVFNATDNVFPAAMQATDKYIGDNSERYLQKVIDDSIGDNQTEIIAYGKGTANGTPTTGTAWVGNRLSHKAGTLKSITFNALKANEEYKFVIATFDSVNQKLTFTSTYLYYTPSQAGVITFSVPAGIVLEVNQSVFLSVNTTGKIGYTLDSAITDCEYCETAGGSNVAYTPRAGFVSIVMNVEVHKGRVPFSVEEMMLKIYEDLNGSSNENLDFTTTVTLDKTKSIKYTKLTGLNSFIKGNTLLLDKVCTYKLTGGSVTFSSDFLALENSKPYEPTKTNVIKFFKEYGKIRYTNEVLPLEPI